MGRDARGNFRMSRKACLPPPSFLSVNLSSNPDSGNSQVGDRRSVEEIEEDEKWKNALIVGNQYAAVVKRLTRTTAIVEVQAENDLVVEGIVNLKVR